MFTQTHMVGTRPPLLHTITPQHPTTYHGRYDVKQSPHRVILRRGNSFSIDAVVPKEWKAALAGSAAGDQWKNLELVLRHPDKDHRYSVKPSSAAPKNVASEEADEKENGSATTSAPSTTAAVTVAATTSAPMLATAGGCACKASFEYSGVTYTGTCATE